MSAAGEFQSVINEVMQSIRRQLGDRCQRSSQALKTASMLVLSQPGSGRVYGGHAASAPGEPPAPQTGAFRGSWSASSQTGGDVYVSKLESGSFLAPMLEGGTGKMAPRPHQKRIQEKALPEILRIYEEPYV